MHKNVKFIILIYQFFLLFPIFSSEKLQRKLDNKQTITAIYFGKQQFFAVSSSSQAIPESAYKTSPETKNKVYYNDGKITINNNKTENNITLVFYNNRKKYTNLFRDLGYIKKLTYLISKRT